MHLNWAFMSSYQSQKERQKKRRIQEECVPCAFNAFTAIEALDKVSANGATSVPKTSEFQSGHRVVKKTGRCIAICSIFRIGMVYRRRYLTNVLYGTFKFVGLRVL